MEDYVARREHEEFAKRIEAEDHRQNRRIEELENSVKQFTSVTASAIEKLTASLESMIKEQERQRERLETQTKRMSELEKEPVNTWKHIKTKALDTGVGIVAGALVAGLVMMAAQYL